MPPAGERQRFVKKNPLELLFTTSPIESDRQRRCRFPGGACSPMSAGVIDSQPELRLRSGSCP
jgi:hypothetical protein